MDKQEWISVGERLPEYGRVVLVSTPAGVVQHVSYFLDASEIEDAAWWQACIEEELLLAVRSFSHWMPLPAPPHTAPRA